MSNLTPKFFSQNSEISSSLPGSWLPNSLAGKPRIASPLLAYFSCNSSSCSYCGVRPHWLATLTISTTLPLYFDRSTGLPLKLFILILSAEGALLSPLSAPWTATATQPVATAASKERIQSCVVTLSSVGFEAVWTDQIIPISPE